MKADLSTAFADAHYAQDDRGGGRSSYRSCCSLPGMTRGHSKGMAKRCRASHSWLGECFISSGCDRLPGAPAVQWHKRGALDRKGTIAHEGDAMCKVCALWQQQSYLPPCAQHLSHRRSGLVQGMEWHKHKAPFRPTRGGRHAPDFGTHLHVTEHCSSHTQTNCPWATALSGAAHGAA